MGCRFFYNDEVETSSALAFYTDAALSIGFGGFFGNEWFSESWPVELDLLEIGRASCRERVSSPV